MLAYIFPGQGAQEKGMEKDLFPQFSQLLEQANDFLGYSIQTLCLEDPDNLLNKTSHTQIAIYVVNALHYFARQQSIATQADFVAGHSLGEYNALLAANVFDFMTGLQLVQRRAQLMAQAQHGGMAAIVGLTHDELLSLIHI